MTTDNARPVRLLGYDHVGIRVTERERALTFYRRLGFEERVVFHGHEANEMVSADGLRINLIFNGAARAGGRNILLDEAVKWPGATHPAFIVDDLERLQALLAAAGIRITEGPHRIGPRRIALFIRDPDGNVLEFNQLLDPREETPMTDRLPLLYDLEPSGNCYKVRLFASLAGIALDLQPVDFLAGAHKQAPVIDLNPWGQLPVLVDGDVTLRDSQAILIYLARRYGGEAWWPSDAARQAEVAQWLSTAANEIQHGPCAARLIRKFGLPLDEAAARKTSAHILGLIEAHLVHHDWLAASRPTIADCAIFPYVALAPEGGIDLTPYPFIRAWLTRVRSLPHFLPVSGLPEAA